MNLNVDDMLARLNHCSWYFLDAIKM